MKKHIKKLLAIVCAVLFCMSCFAACGSNNTSSESGTDSESVVVDKNPEVVDEPHGYYYAASPADVTFDIRLNGGTFESLKFGETALTKNTDYKFNGGTEILTLYSTYLETLSTGDYVYTFVTDKGSCDITMTVGGSDLIEGYDLEFAIPEKNSTADHFFTKISRDDEKVKFDFISFGDFTSEGTSLEFINLLIDKSPYDDTKLNWRFGSEDLNVRVYSNGTVIYRDNFTGTEVKNGTANGLDNIWWKTDWNAEVPNYKTSENVTVTRQNGITKLTLELSYQFLGIESTDAFRFVIEEASDASQFDFNLYESGIMSLNGKAFANPQLLSAWPMLDKDGKIVRPENIVIERPNAPDGYNLEFGQNTDDVNAKVSLEEDGSGVTFSFWTFGNFTKTSTNKDKFMNIYLDMPTFNTNGYNWCFESNDINVRVYSDGTVYKRSGFNRTQDNVWYPRTQLTDDNKLTQTATITRDLNTGTYVEVTLTWEQLGLANKEAFEGLRFWLAECSDIDANFAYDGANLTLNGVKAGNDYSLPSWPIDRKSVV